jgi:hypothetical protein
MKSKTYDDSSSMPESVKTGLCGNVSAKRPGQWIPVGAIPLDVRERMLDNIAGVCFANVNKEYAPGGAAEALSAAAGGNPATMPLLPPPTAWRWGGYKLRGVEWHYALHRTRGDAEPLYSKDALIEYGRRCALLHQQTEG